jgi:anti-sigma regulatory factor (Ser/Thr protein kinase)
VLDACARWKLDVVAQVASLLVSEIVTNAVLHSKSTAELVLRCQPGLLQIEVRDHSSQLPERRAPDPLSVTGRGMLIVDQLSSSWGAERLADGKRVWCTLAFGSGLQRSSPAPVAHPSSGVAEAS